jgi:outer membrane protein OmpA-like peptidoglycan-associated protein
MGFPINSKDDDFGIVFNKEGTAGFFSSDRMGGVGRDDIYSFKRNAIPVEVLVYDERTGNPLPGATVNVVCKNKSMITNQDGIVTIDMKLDECCNFKASLAEYEPNTAEGCTKNLTLSDKMLLRIPLMRSAEFEVEGIVYDAGTGLPLEGAFVSIENTCGQKIAEPIVTLDNGKYYFKLDKECCYKIKATKNGYFAGIADNVCTKGLTTSTTFKENLYLQPTSLIAGGDKKPGAKLEETPYTYLDPALGLWVDKKKRLPADGIYPDGKIYEKGILKKGGPGFDRGPIDPTADNPEITYLLHIYYDFDQAYVRDDAITELNKLYTLMVENPQYIIEIGSHTDARGSNHYNHRLSQRRAESVVRWLVDKGIGKDRLVPRGYGETKNVNDCTNNVPCSEKQHQLNRRTEFKVIGCKDCVDPEKTAISKENPNVRVDPCKSCPF